MKNKIEELKKGCKREFLNSTGEFRLKCGFKNLYSEYAYKDKVVFCPDCNNEIYIVEEAQKEIDNLKRELHKALDSGVCWMNKYKKLQKEFDKKVEKLKKVLKTHKPKKTITGFGLDKVKLVLEIDKIFKGVGE